MGKLFIISFTLFFTVTVASGQECRLDSVLAWVQRTYNIAESESDTRFVINGMIYELPEAERELDKERSAGRKISDVIYIKAHYGYGGRDKIHGAFIAVSTRPPKKRLLRRDFTRLMSDEPGPVEVDGVLLGPDDMDFYRQTLTPRKIYGIQYIERPGGPDGKGLLVIRTRKWTGR